MALTYPAPDLRDRAVFIPALPFPHSGLGDDRPGPA